MTMANGQLPRHNSGEHELLGFLLLDYFAYSKEFFKAFLSDPKNMENLKSEFFIPLMVDKLINDGTATVEVLILPANGLE